MHRIRNFLIVSIILVCLVGVYLVVGFIPAQALSLYGPPARSLSITDRIDYSRRLLSYGELLTMPVDPNGIEQSFNIQQDESILSIANRLEDAGIITSAQALYDYLVYTGLDTTLQSGDYKLSPALSIIDVAQELQDSTPEDVPFVIIPGWRLEEIAASLPTSGLDISPEEFFHAATTQTPPQGLGFASTTSLEGFLLPDSYTFLRNVSVEQFLKTMADNFVMHVTDDMRAGFAEQGLDVYQAVTLASIVERESVHDDEQALIASVFINRLNGGMQLGSDPTVQYALGFDPVEQTWWTNPLSLDNLKIDSPYNTYVYAGLPPGPIANPSIEALRAVAFPEHSDYYYFQAKCDNSGYHTFAVTLEEHVANGCQ
jgi:UPF0755 protein